MKLPQKGGFFDLVIPVNIAFEINVVLVESLIVL